MLMKQTKPETSINPIIVRAYCQGSMRYAAPKSPKGLSARTRSSCGPANTAGPVSREAYDVRPRKVRMAFSQGRNRGAAPQTPQGQLSGKHTEAYDVQLGCSWSSDCKMAFEFVREQAVRTFRRRTSYDSLTTSPAEFAGRTSIAAVRTGPSDFWDRTLYASLLTGPAMFAGPQLDCVPANRPFGLFRAAHGMLP